jgi:zinc/manganese transport system permease protein
MFTNLLAQHFVHTALLAGAVVAVVSGAIGIFVVTRGASFAVHAISELGFTGAAGALVVGIDPVIGMIGGSLAVGLVLGLLSLRGRERDSAIGAVLAFGLGIGVLFLSLYHGYATQATNLLFGSIVGVSSRQLLELAIVALIVMSGIAVLYRPLLFSSVDPEVAAARGVPLRALSVAIFLLLALTTAEAIQVVGVLLVLTLVITPAAAAQRLTARPAVALMLSVLIALAATEGGILLSLAQPWPTSFFISAISFSVYVAARVFAKRSATTRMFASRCETFEVPGIGRITGEWSRSQRSSKAESRRPSPSGRHGMNAMPSDSHASSTTSEMSRPRLNSFWTETMRATDCAARSWSSDTFESPINRIFPSSRNSWSAPTDSSIGTSGS